MSTQAGARGTYFASKQPERPLPYGMPVSNGTENIYDPRYGSKGIFNFLSGN